MISEIDDLMAKAGFEALLVIGDSTASSPELMYFVRTPIPRGGLYLKRRGAEPLLVVSSLDMGCARRGSVSNIKTYSDYGLRELQRRHGPGRGWAEMVSTILAREGVRGNVALAGRTDILSATHLADLLRRNGFRVTGMAKPTFVDACRRRKDGWEIETIKRVGDKTVSVVQKLEKLLEESDVRTGKVVYEGKQLTTAVLRKHVMVWCSEAGLSLPEGFMLAAGAESSDPHAMAREDKPLTEGEPLLFDIYPADETGYRYDFTRTYCVGRAKPLLRKMFEDVAAAQKHAFDTINAGTRCETPFIEVCRFFRRRRWPTLLDRDVKDKGFIHGLGHGVGLTIGEEPYLTRFSTTPLSSGEVVTVEPGLYVPGFGGVRLEDVVVVDGGKAVVLAEHRRVLEL
ncbi:MAG: M24 family metallopeptidase [Candidatus Caldarchaeum sp.]